MPRKLVLVVGPVALGVLLVAWAARSSNGAPEPTPPRGGRPMAAKRGGTPPEAPAEASPRLEAPAPPRTPVPLPAADGENALIVDRIGKLEEKLRQLEARRAALVVSNQDLEKQVTEKAMEGTWRAMAEGRVRVWESLLGLSETQKQAFLELWMKWMKEDGGRPQGRDAWLAREIDVRSRLSAEQSARLHESTSTQSRRTWSQMGQTIGGMIGASKDDQVRIQQSLGEYRAANEMLLPEAYGADWAGQLKEASAQLQPLLSPDQMTKLERFVRR